MEHPGQVDIQGALPLRRIDVLDHLDHRLAAHSHDPGLAAGRGPPAAVGEEEVLVAAGADAGGFDGRNPGPFEEPPGHLDEIEHPPVGHARPEGRERVHFEAPSADRLPEELTAEISYDDVTAVLAAHCDYLAAKGVASAKAADDIGDALVVVPDDEPVAWVIGRLEEQGETIADEVVVTVLDVEEQYYEAIGAIGPRVSDSDDGGA